ncbi:FecR family protein [Chitinilyticum litopenaei]|uniref:FecR family protein n=1 Tax=Chitinilyticum litopenaei TaxID=1121276 RepID=UPI000400D78E|nr:FecR family protein [Chitinilyticum litopenaei]
MTNSYTRMLVAHVTAALAMLLMPQGHAAPQPMGQVLSINGSPQLERGGEVLALRAGDAVYPGDRLTTADNDSAYIKTVDHGFLVVRPSSRLAIEAYGVDLSGVEQYKFRLEHGVVRAVSGAKVKQSRDKYRLNTPVAAIGLRGTDFIVRADASTTQVAVLSGGVVMSPFGSDCKFEGAGPCEGFAARELSASREKMLEYRQGDVAPVILENAQQQLRQLAPDLLSATRDLGGATGGGQQKDQVSGGVDDLKTGFNGSVVVRPEIVQPDLTGANGDGAVKPRQIYWGRWRDVAGLKNQVSLDEFLAGRARFSTTLAYVGAYSSARELPEVKTGTASFALAEHEGLFIDTRTGSALSMSAERAALTVDFARSTFNTELDLKGPGMAYQLSANGTIDKQGHMQNSPISNVTIQGVLAGKQAHEAGYVYQQGLGEGKYLTGATYWNKLDK